jgi:hypothetical protein
MVALISTSSVFGYLSAIVLAWVVFPVGVAYIRSHPRTFGLGRDEEAAGEADYWRTGAWDR